MAAKAYQRDGKLSGIATGLRDLDIKMGGLQPSDLIIVAGRPGMGKTALATNIAYNIAKAHRAEVQPDGTMKSVNGGIVGFFSCEMSAEQLATRILAEQTSIASSTIRRGGITETDFEKIRDYSIELQSLPLYVDETGGLSISQLTARARRLKRQKGLDSDRGRLHPAVCRARASAADNRVQEVTEITTSLKALAKELNVPIIALSQLSRQVESRDDKRPQLVRPARIRLDRAGRRRRDVRVIARNITSPNKEPRAGTPEHEKWQLDMDRWCTARPKSSSASSATARPARSNCSSRASSPASAISRTTAICRSGPTNSISQAHLAAVEPPRSRRVQVRHEHRLRSQIDSAGSLLSPEANQAAALADRDRHAHGRSRRHRRQLAQAREDRGAGRMRRA